MKPQTWQIQNLLFSRGLLMALGFFFWFCVWSFSFSNTQLWSPSRLRSYEPLTSASPLSHNHIVQPAVFKAAFYTWDLSNDPETEGERQDFKGEILGVWCGTEVASKYVSCDLRSQLVSTAALGVDVPSLGHLLIKAMFFISQCVSSQSPVSLPQE